ncbi:MAG: substrate-binding domain-containing protein [Oscillatoriales cyanobacterium C42_A2020_001]|nr:substrate-binding domain-containing protein [Leptolyngbyaceae cyanobacterium C42_A2020_001]
MPSPDCGAIGGWFQWAQALLQHTRRPTVILVMGDRLAIGTIRASKASSLSVPHDGAIVGFDDIPLTA